MKKPQCLTIVTQNCKGAMVKRKVAILSLLATKKPDIIILTETNHSNKFKSAMETSEVFQDTLHCAPLHWRRMPVNTMEWSC